MSSARAPLARWSTPPLPLDDRLPNPPPTFVGRADELRWLRAAIRRAPVTVIHGDEGFGKSALALAALHRFGAERVARTLYLNLRHYDPHEPVALPLLRALLRARGTRDVDWRELIAAPEGLGALAIDLTEGAELWVVLDDLHDAAHEGAHDLLRTLSRYARRSRFVVTTRTPPELHELAGQLLRLGPLPLAELSRLARLLDPTRSTSEARALAAAACGSPSRLQTPAREPPQPESARELLRHALDPEVPIEARLRAAGTLVERPDPDLRLAALRAFATSGREDLVRTWFERVGEELLAGGFAPALWAIVDGLVDPRSEPMRLRVAVELGDREALARVREPEGGRVEDRLLWVTALIAKSRFAEAAEVANGIREDRDVPKPIAVHAAFLQAQAIGSLGRLEDALALLDAVEPAPDDDLGHARRDALRALIASLLLREDLALTHVEGARRRLGVMPPAERAAAGVRLSRALYNLCRFRDASRILDQVSAGDAPGSVRFDVGRNVRFMHACLALDLGELDRARAELDALEPYLGKTAHLRAHVENARGTLAALDGNLEELDRAIATLRALDPGPRVAVELELLELRARLLRREPLPDDAHREEQHAGIFTRLAQLHRLRLDLHVGAREPRDVLAELGTLPTHHEERVFSRLIAAEARLALGDPSRANVEATAAIADAEEHELALYAAEGLAVRCDALAASGDLEALATATRELANKAGALPSSRLVALARFHELLSQTDVRSGTVDHAALAALSADALRTPEAALRARALLVDEAPLGVVDRAVLDAFRARVGYVPPRRARPSDPPRADFGIDLRRGGVWLPSGARIDLSRHALLRRILECLAAHGGAASKEELVLEVWGERSYHPLRHDNRLHAAIRKLRRQLGDEKGASRWVLTTPEGYALAEGALVVDAKTA